MLNALEFSSVAIEEAVVVLGQAGALEHCEAREHHKRVTAQKGLVVTVTIEVGIEGATGAKIERVGKGISDCLQLLPDKTARVIKDKENMWGVQSLLNSEQQSPI